MSRRLAALLVVLATGVALAQEAGTAWLRHGFPLAGDTLLIVVGGLEPGEHVMLELADPGSAPPSVVSFLESAPSARREHEWPATYEDGLQKTVWSADQAGRIALPVPLEHPDDAGRSLVLGVMRHPGDHGGRSAPLHLTVQPPQLLLPTADGLARIDLRDGRHLLPSIPGESSVRGAAFSKDGVQAWLLRGNGLLELRSAERWGGETLAAFRADPDADTLGGSPLGGAAFLLSRAGGDPYAPAASLAFLDGTRDVLRLESMGQSMAGRRAVLTPDGFSAWLAEDDLLVREVDLLERRPRGLFSAGMAGDVAITDMLLDGRRLLVATRAPGGAPGALTVLELDSGRTSVQLLGIDPLRLVPLGDEAVLVVPAAGGAGQFVQAGLPLHRIDMPATTLLDAAPVTSGALLLRQGAQGPFLQGLHQETGRLVRLTGPGALPPVTRLVGQGTDVVVLLGDPSGAVHVYEATTRVLRELPDVTALPGDVFAVLP
ncbi:MAG: hypothetical protein ACYTG2_10950 [Planctomycetota bacterium]|jgi:hypothetical protein